MLKLTITDLENDRVETRFGTEHELADYLQNQYLQTRLGAVHLDDVVNVLNETDKYSVTVEPYEPGVEQNRLPPDYLTQSQTDAPDPWPRVGERV